MAVSPRIQSAIRWAAGAALAAAAHVVLTHPDPLSLPGLKAVAVEAIGAVLLTLASLFREPPRDPAQVGTALVAQVAKAAEAGHLDEGHVEAIQIAATLPPSTKEPR